MSIKTADETLSCLIECSSSCIWFHFSAGFWQHLWHINCENI